MKRIILLNIILCFSIGLVAQTKPKKAIKELGPNPVFFVDSLRVSRSDLQNFQPDDIASLTIYKDKEATDILGEEGKDGVVYIETKLFCRKRYWEYFKSKSQEYAQIVPTIESDSPIQYIINKRVLVPNSPGDLAAINDEVFKGIQIIDKETLIKDYSINDKMYGVIITSDVPKNLYHGKKKF